jgi:hypothetical protein
MLTASLDELRDRRFTTAELCDCAHLPATLVNQWQSRGFLNPMEGGGKGTARLFSAETVCQTTIAAILIRQGLSAGEAFAAAGESLNGSGDYLLVDPRDHRVPNWPHGIRYGTAPLNVAEAFGHGPPVVPTSQRGTPPPSTDDVKGPRHVAVLVVELKEVIKHIADVATKTPSTDRAVPA